MILISLKGKVKAECDVKFDENENGVELLYGNKTNCNNRKDNLVVVNIDTDDMNDEKIEIQENIEETVQEDWRKYLKTTWKRHLKIIMDTRMQ